MNNPSFLVFLVKNEKSTHFFEVFQSHTCIEVDWLVFSFHLEFELYVSIT